MGKRGLGAAVALIMLMAAIVAPMAAYSAENPVKLTVMQSYSASPTSPGDTFNYRLKALNDYNPMPAGSDALGYQFSIAGNGSKEIGPLAFDEPGVYLYEVFQVIGTESPGYTYDKRVYRVEAHVTASLFVTVVVFDEDGKKEDKIVFENAYEVLPTDPLLMTDPPVIKTVSGNPGSAGLFTFKLVARNASQPMPPGSAGGEKTLQIVGSGQGEFGVWAYEKAGTYYYTVYEVNSGASGYTYDKAVYTITDTVKLSGNQLVLSRVVTNGLNKAVSSMIFNNSYKSGGAVQPPGGGQTDPGGPKQGVDGPKTGDYSNINLYWVMFAIGGALALGTTMYLVAGRKPGKARI